MSKESEVTMRNMSFLEWWTLIFTVILAFVIFASILTVLIGSIMNAGTVTEDDFQDYSRAPDILERIRSKLSNGETLSAQEDHWLQWATKEQLVEIINGEYEPGRLMREMLTRDTRVNA